MINTSAVTITSSTFTGSTQNKQPSGDFMDVLSSKESFAQLTSDLLDNLLKSRANSNSGAASITGLFPFSQEFTSTFGDSGPLPEFINRITASLKLTAEQNQALQAISVRNKDITKTPENVQRIAAELKAAGIG